MKAFVVRGYGIECEEEMRRAAMATNCFESVEDFILPKFFNSPQRVWPFTKNDWILLPGGFSYSDHFGSGKLLALRLLEAGFFNAAYSQGSHFFGACNGFQILVEAGAFGSNVKLNLNQPRGFCNRWVQLESHESSLRLPVRHGEGCLTVEGDLSKHVKSFLKYKDSEFTNGSKDNIAGLSAEWESSQIWGMMPHAEIALLKQDDPDFFACDFMPQHQESQSHLEGDGLKLLKNIFKGTI